MLISYLLEKSSFVIFQLKRVFCIRYLGILMDSNLNLKGQIEGIVKKIRRSIGILAKLRYYVGLHIVKLSFLTLQNSNNKQPCFLHTYLNHVTMFSLRGLGSGLSVLYNFRYTAPSCKLTVLSATISMTKLNYEQRKTVKS